MINSRLNVAKFSLDDFYLIDIRGKQAFLSAHLKNSHHLSSQNEIISFFKSQNEKYLHKKIPLKPLLILCFSAVRAKKMSENLAKNAEFLALYPHNEIFYLNCGIMEAFDSGFEVCAGDDIADKSVNFQGFWLKNDEQLKEDFQDKDKIGFQTPPQNPLVAKTIATLKEKYLSHKKAWVVTFSGGKDSTCVLQLVYEMLVSLPAHLRRQTYAIASNTLVEAPHIDRFLCEVVASINAHAKAHNIPFEVIMVAPSLKDDFWVNLIGKGYPSPTRTFRWCTERLKINPAKAQVAKITARHGSCILLLGSRKAESSNRKHSIEKRILNEDGYSQHHDFPDTLTYSPIAEWDTDAVWGYLLSHKPLWDKDHSELFALYSKASGDECQFITDLRQSSCGGSRFGCWVCTVVNEDKSMQGFISTGETHLKPLNEFRNYIKALREDKEARSDYKRDGRAVYKIGGLGPFLSSKRIEIFTRLLEAERKFKKNGGVNLITDAQILGIQAEWDRDFDLDKTGIKIAQKFGRLKEYKMEKSKILHREILEEVVEQMPTNQAFSVQDVENLIIKSVEICASVRNSQANTLIKAEIAKILDDKSAKNEDA